MPFFLDVFLGHDTKSKQIKKNFLHKVTSNFKPFFKNHRKKELHNYHKFAVRRAQKKEKDRIKGKGRRFCFGGQNLCNSLPRQLFCTRTILKNMTNSSFSFKSSWCNSSCYSKSSSAKQLQQHGKERNKFFPPKRSDDLCLFFCLYLYSIEGIIAIAASSTSIL